MISIEACKVMFANDMWFYGGIGFVIGSLLVTMIMLPHISVSRKMK